MYELISLLTITLQLTLVKMNSPTPLANSIVLFLTLLLDEEKRWRRPTFSSTCQQTERVLTDPDPDPKFHRLATALTSDSHDNHTLID